jgi:hypothetical protein
MREQKLVALTRSPKPRRASFFEPLQATERQVGIASLIRDKAFDPEDVELMGAAFDHVCRVLRLPARNGDARSTAAVLIIELMARGERNPSKLAYAAIRELDKSPTGRH